MISMEFRVYNGGPQKKAGTATGPFNQPKPKLNQKPNQ